MKLLEIFDQHKGKETVKYEHYLCAYEKFFLPFRDKEITIVEVGVADGGSLEIWQEYFGNKAKVIGIDIQDRTGLKLAGNIHIVQGNQASDSFWDDFLGGYPQIDIFIDDGSHEPADQIFTFKRVFPHMEPGAIFICEDLKRDTLFWDCLAWDDLRSNIRSITFMHMLTIIEKGDMAKELHSPLFRGGRHDNNIARG